MVNLEDYRALFMMATLGLALVAVSPMLGVILPFGRGSERFSEFWLLGPDHMAEGYPFNVRAGEEYSVFVGVGNHMGSSEYYKVCVKFCNGSLFQMVRVVCLVPCLRFMSTDFLLELMRFGSRL